MKAQQQTTWSGRHYLSSHSGWKRSGIKNCSITNNLNGTEDDVLWAKQYDKFYTDSQEQGDDISLFSTVNWSSNLEIL